VGDGGESQRGFHPCEGLADALAAATTKREIGEAGAGGLGLRGVALGAEYLGLGEPAGVALDNVLAEEDHGAFLQ